MIILKADERQACARTVGRVTTGSVGIPVELELSDDFDGLAVTICFECGDSKADVVWYDGAEVTVPAQLLAHEGEKLKVGVYGARADGEVVIPTVWATADVVRLGAVPSGVDPSQPEPDWTAQVQSIAAEAIETANAVKAAADAGEFDGFSPIASVAKSGDTATITITDKDGTTTADVNDGIQGADGVSPSVAITDSDSSHTVTITDSTGDHSYTVPTYADEEQAREDAWDALESTVTDARDEALSAAALARNVNGNRLAKTLSGTVLTADDAYAAPPIDAVIYGASTQDGTPTPSAPVPIESVDALTLHATTVPLEGRNLLRKTGDFAAADIVRLRSTVPEPGIARITPTTSSAFVKFKVDYLDFDEYGDGTYTVSFDARLADVESSYTSNSLIVYFGFNVPSRIGSVLNSSYDRYGSATVATNALTSDWQRLHATFDVPDDLKTGQASALVAGSQMSVQLGENGSNKPIDVRRVKLERGTVATDWTPAIEDADATGWPVSIGLQGYQLRSLPDGTRDELTLTPEGTAYRVTLTQRVGSTTTAATDGITGTVGVDVMSTTGEIADGPTVTYALTDEQTIDLGTVAMSDLPAPDVNVWADGGSAQPSLSVTYERDLGIVIANLEAAIADLATS